MSEDKATKSSLTLKKNESTEKRIINGIEIFCPTRAAESCIKTSEDGIQVKAESYVFPFSSGEFSKVTVTKEEDVYRIMAQSQTDRRGYARISVITVGHQDGVYESSFRIHVAKRSDSVLPRMSTSA